MELVIFVTVILSKPGCLQYEILTVILLSSTIFSFNNHLPENSILYTINVKAVMSVMYIVEQNTSEFISFLGQCNSNFLGIQARLFMSLPSFLCIFPWVFNCDQIELIVTKLN